MGEVKEIREGDIVFFFYSKPYPSWKSSSPTDWRCRGKTPLNLETLFNSALTRFFFLPTFPSPSLLLLFFPFLFLHFHHIFFHVSPSSFWSVTSWDNVVTASTCGNMWYLLYIWL